MRYTIELEIWQLQILQRYANMNNERLEQTINRIIDKMIRELDFTIQYHEESNCAKN